MRRLIGMLMALLTLASPCGAWTRGANPPPQTADPLASQAAQNVLLYLQNVGRRTSHRVISGQHIGGGNCCSTSEYIENSYPAVWQALCSGASACPGYAGFSYNSWNTKSPGTVPDFTYINPWIKSVWAAGSIVEIVISPNNPWNNQWWSYNICGGSGTIADLVTPGNSAYTNWHAQLDAWALGFADLQTAGVPIILRFLGENNGTANWWSVCNPGWSQARYSAVWVDAFNYLTRTKGIHNLLWGYCSSAPTAGPSGLTLYPGSQYVDIVGIDLYYDPTYQGPEGFWDDWREWKALGKPMTLFERGPHDTSPNYAWTGFQTLMPSIVNNRGSSLPMVAMAKSWFPLVGFPGGGNAFIQDTNAANQPDVKRALDCMAAATNYTARVACVFQ